YNAQKLHTHNVGLGEAAKRGVGTGLNQLPDMSNFSSNNNSNGWMTLPNGLIFQWVRVVGSSSSTGGLAVDVTEFNFPVPFPTVVYAAFPGSISYVQAVRSVEKINLKGASLLVQAHSGQVISGVTTCVLVIGR
ncbi:gp53-like domain-containing protein, partial [Enterobacter hormaechei]